ncbi:HigA family addiction module antidote protein [Roseomonas sp. SSH11]|uniref:HigA family addiction module antidote protein n=1 Tax=Pararoseomonas baculiformis TaxID=2820812 RepID=A0ABS4AMF8_9PROT|nr:HigA family addiction module antitoxin [Pararoseomonas baculiformis]MBP0447713.1 HigA family addiction module antidote protein [Pararoseomonas baculiformis]
MSREPPALCSPAAPPHPGLLLRDCVLPALGITVSQAALDLATTRQTLHRILAGRSAITPDMAVRLERFCGIPAGFWLGRQQDHDLSLAQAALPARLTRLPQHPLPDAVLDQIGAPHD